MTLPDTADRTDTGEEAEGAPRRPRRRRLAPGAHPFFRFGFPVLVAVGAVVVFLLYQEGARAVLDSTGGQPADPVQDPNAPGYLAFATPTPTVLVAHVDEANSLVGVTVLAQTAFERGGSAVVLSADLLVDPADAEPAILGRIFATEGVAGLESIVGAWFGFGFTDDPVVLDPTQLGLWLSLVEPIPFVLLDDLVVVDAEGLTSIVIGEGGREYDGPTLAEIYAWRNPSEVDAARFSRQEAIWEAWLASIGEADDALAATTVFGPLPQYLRALGTGSADVSIAPMSPLDFGPDDPIYSLAEADFGWPAKKAAEMVPLPVAHRPGARPTVQVLDGTGDPTNRQTMLPVLVEAGAEIAVIGNAASFDVATTTVTYHQAQHQSIAEDFGAAIGAAVGFVDDPNQPVELTVTIGMDLTG